MQCTLCDTTFHNKNRIIHIFSKTHLNKVLAKDTEDHTALIMS